MKFIVFFSFILVFNDILEREFDHLNEIYAIQI